MSCEYCLETMKPDIAFKSAQFPNRNNKEAFSYKRLQEWLNYRTLTSIHVIRFAIKTCTTEPHQVPQLCTKVLG